MNNYYAASPEETESTTLAALGEGPVSNGVTVDRPFLEQIWRWLVQHPDIRVGKNRESHNFSLSQAEASYQESVGESHPQKGLGNPPASQFAHSIPINPVGPKQVPSNNDNESAILRASTSELRLYTTEARVWQAIAGHGPDDRRVPPSQFRCLSIISSRRSQGILQTDLVKISGQDKRSVPKRTDSLAENGYIEKRPVLSKGIKTSLLFAKRFAPNTGRIISNATVSEKGSGRPPVREAKFIDYRSVYDATVEILREPKIVTIIDCKKRLVCTIKLALLSCTNTSLG